MTTTTEDKAIRTLRTQYGELQLSTYGDTAVLTTSRGARHEDTPIEINGVRYVFTMHLRYANEHWVADGAVYVRRENPPLDWRKDGPTDKARSAIYGLAKVIDNYLREEPDMVHAGRLRQARSRVEQARGVVDATYKKLHEDEEALIVAEKELERLESDLIFHDAR